jgi:hypothetical protein
MAPLSQSNQSGANWMSIWQDSKQERSDSPTADQSTTVSQSNDTGKNSAIVQQQVWQQVSDAAASQDQEAEQLLCLTQDSASGANQATVKQLVNQQERDSAKAATQYQNKEYGPLTYSCGNSPAVQAPNMIAEVLQDEQAATDTGRNQDNVKQGLQEQEKATATSGTGSQQQGSGGYYGTTTGGLQAVPDQDSSGVSKAFTTQDEQQCMHAASPAESQAQYDPIRQPPGEGSQGTNPADVFKLSQHSVQAANPSASQFYDLIGDCLSSGGCHVRQAEKSNAGARHQTCGCHPPGTCSKELTNNY